MFRYFVIRGMMAHCDQGSDNNYLNTKRGHGFYYQGQPVLNANDYKEFKGFGQCRTLGGKCRPDTTTPWKQCNENFLIEGAPALLQESFCYCKNEGFIYINPIRLQRGSLVQIPE